jgi:hypothetical protein
MHKRANGLVEAQKSEPAIKASAFDRSTSKPSLDKRLRPFEPMMKDRVATIASSMPARRQKVRPMLKEHPATGALWQRYLTSRRCAAPKRSGVIGRAIGNWKWLLLAET